MDSADGVTEQRPDVELIARGGQFEPVGGDGGDQLLQLVEGPPVERAEVGGGGVHESNSVVLEGISYNLLGYEGHSAVNT